MPSYGSEVHVAITDVHGHADLLRDLHVRIATATQGYTWKDVTYLGDYIDRGPDSRGVIDLAIGGLPEFSKVYLKGNHEALMIFKPEIDHEQLLTWLRNGGDTALASYGIQATYEDFWNLPSRNAMAEKASDLRKSLFRALPAEHLSFLLDLRTIHQTEKAIFVHAGLNPEFPIDRQTDDDLLWIRQEFLTSDFDWGRPVIHGHTPSRFGPEILPNRINLDTGAFSTGILTSMALDGKGDARFITASTPQEAIAIVSHAPSLDARWVQWAADVVMSSGAQHAAIDLPAEALEVLTECLKKARFTGGIEALSTGALAAAMGEPDTPIGKAISEMKGRTIFSDVEAAQTLRQTLAWPLRPLV